MLKRSKADKSIDDGAKSAKKKAALVTNKDGSTRTPYFWETWAEKRRKNKMPVRESSIPKPPMSKEDRLKLIVAAVIAVLVPLIFVYLTTRPAPTTDSKKGPNPAAKTEDKATKAAGSDDG